jgi:hypothetical protein
MGRPTWSCVDVGQTGAFLVVLCIVFVLLLMVTLIHALILMFCRWYFCDAITVLCEGFKVLEVSVV